MDDTAPGSVGAAMRETAIVPMACAVIVAVASILNTMDVGVATSGDDASVGLDAQVALKLMLAGVVAVIGMFGVLLSRHVQHALFGVPGIFLVSLGVAFLVTSIFAYKPAGFVCLAAALIFLAYLFFVPTAVTLIGLRAFMIAIMVGLTLHMLASWTLYLFVPALGVFAEELADGVIVQRMGGMGHPNSVARVAGLAGVLSLALLRSNELCPRFTGARSIMIGIIVLAAVTMLASFSRTALVATIAAASFLLIDRILSRNGMILVASGVVLLLVALLWIDLTTDSDTINRRVLSATTKTGDVQELTSGTGRTEIWGEAIRLIAQRPLTGWGLNSAPLLMTDFSHHTHNAVLHAMFSGGIVAGTLLILLLGWNLFFGLRDSEPIVRAISIFILVSGLVEDTIIDTFPFPTTTLWIFALLYPALSAAENKLAAIQPRKTLAT